MSEILNISTHSHLWFTAFLKLRKNKQRSRVSSIRTMDINSRNLRQQEEDLDKKKFRKMASMSRSNNWAISFVKAPTTTYTLKNLLRHLLLNGHFKLGESTRNWDAKCESAIHYSMSFQQGGALLINFFEYCKNFRKISFTALVPHHNYQYYHTGAWLDCRTNALQPQSVSTAVFINDKQQFYHLIESNGQIPNTN